MRERNPWRRLVLGAIGGATGTLAMGYYLQLVSRLSRSGRSATGSEEPVEKRERQGLGADLARLWHDNLKDIAIAGKHYRQGETSTQTVGRLVYRFLSGKEPECAETLNLLSEAAHWAFGTKTGAIYGLARADARGSDLRGGMWFGAVVWLFASELSLPLLGLSAGPSDTPISAHINYLGAHLVYGAATAATTHTLAQLLG